MLTDILSLGCAGLASAGIVQSLAGYALLRRQRAERAD